MTPPTPNKKHSSFRWLMLAIGLSLSHATWSANATPEQDEQPKGDVIIIEGTPYNAHEASEEITTSKDIQDKQINSQHDLVKYNPEISVAEVGRYGSKGFSIRGVDGNRVAMTYDGVNLPNQQINQVFSGYGYMYEGRYAPDMELLSAVRLKAGSDSFNSGNGAMGGAVEYKSKDPYDLIKPEKNTGAYAKTGYTSKNEEYMLGLGVATRFERASAIINYAYRDGHELKNHRMLDFNKAKLDPNYDFANDPDYQYPSTGYVNSKASILPDPQHYTSHAVMGKLNYDINEQHQLHLQGTHQERLNQSHGFSKTTTTGERITFDESNMQSVGLGHTYTPSDSAWLEEAKTQYTHQKITGIANTYLYLENSTTGQHELDGNKYRPQYDTTDQLNINADFAPIYTERAGDHELSLKFNYAQTDHELIMKEWARLQGPDLNRYLFIGPSVKKDIISLALTDEVAFDKLNTQFGLRYDRHKYAPYMTDINRTSIQDTSDEYYAKRLFLDGEFDKTKHISNLGWQAGVNYTFNPNWQLGYQASTGFLAPSVSQMYSAFEMLGNRLTTNVDLKPEKSINQSLSLQGDFKSISTHATVYHTQYRDFIKTVTTQREESTCYTNSSGSRVCSPMIRNYIMADNIDKAKTYGIRLGAVADISNWGGIGQTTHGRIQLNAQTHFAKDSTSEGTNLLATQPPETSLGASYQSNNNKHQLHAKLRYLNAKKSEDAKVIDFVFQGTGQKSKQVIVPYEHIDKSTSAFVFDLYGSTTIYDGLKLSAGIYNVFNEKYIPWSNLRSLAEMNINSMVDDDGKGLERYTAPGRNFALSVSYEY